MLKKQKGFIGTANTNLSIQNSSLSSTDGLNSILGDSAVGGLKLKFILFSQILKN